jgi:hypothetical protein
VAKATSFRNYARLALRKIVPGIARFGGSSPNYR